MVKILNLHNSFNFFTFVETVIPNSNIVNKKMTGLVYKSTGSWYTVKSQQDDFIECRIKGWVARYNKLQ